MKPIKILRYLFILLATALVWTGCEPYEPGPEELDVFEPNNTLTNAVQVNIGDSVLLSIYPDDKDWFRLTVPAGSYVVVQIDFEHEDGDLDLTIYDQTTKLIASRMGTDEYPFPNRNYETGTECYALFSAEKTIDYYIAVTGHNKAENNYSLKIIEKAYADGCICEDEGFSSEECIGEGLDGSGLIPFPIPAPNDQALVNNYAWEIMSNYRFARRELIMLVRYAIRETSLAFPGTKPISLYDACQINGQTPALDVGEVRHPATTHDQGGNIDIAYYQTDGQNNIEVICGKGFSSSKKYCKESATDSHIVDLDRQAYFIGKLFDSPRVRVIGTDRVIGPLILEAAEKLADQSPDAPTYLSEIELTSIRNLLVWGDGWPHHHHHIHVSLHWW